jgi:hypothetical protein
MIKNIKLIALQLFIGLLNANLAQAQSQTKDLLGKIEESTREIANFVIIGVVVTIVILLAYLFFRK